jgi:PAS domain S-box-containing protein
MSIVTKTRKELASELDGMRQIMRDADTCRKEFDRVREEYEKIIDAAPDATVFVGRDHRIILVNAQTESLFGYREEELAGKMLEVLIPERFHKQHGINVEGFFLKAEKRPMGTGLRIFARKKDGTEFRADISLSPLKLDGDLIVAASIRDVTERMEAQEKIERDFRIQQVINELLKISLENIPLGQKLEKALDLIVSVPHLALQYKASLYLVEGNELVLQAERGLTEHEKKECLRVPMGKCLCGQAASRCDVIFKDCVDAGHEITFEGMYPHGHFCVPIVGEGKPLGLINVYIREGHKRDPSEEAFLRAAASTLAGTIERAGAEAEKQKLQEELLSSEKFAALGRVAANVAHQIRNPLTSLGGFAKRLQRSLPEGSKQKEYARFIADETMALERILKDVLSYARVSSVNREKLDLRELIERVLKLYEEKLTGQSITVRKSFLSTPEITADSERTREALENIILNAIEAMPSGGHLSIETGMKQYKNGQYAAVIIRDTGPGIPPEAMSKIFEPFFTTKQGGKGVGLGLAIARRIVQDHGGNISVESKPGEGTAVTLYFPLGRPRP